MKENASNSLLLHLVCIVYFMQKSAPNIPSSARIAIKASTQIEKNLTFSESIHDLKIKKQD